MCLIATVLQINKTTYEAVMNRKWNMSYKKYFEKKYSEKKQNVNALVLSISNSYNIRKPCPIHWNRYVSLEQSYKAPVEKDLMRTTFLYVANPRLNLSIILCILPVLIILMIYHILFLKMTHQILQFAMTYFRYSNISAYSHL